MFRVEYWRNEVSKEEFSISLTLPHDPTIKQVHTAIADIIGIDPTDIALRRDIAMFKEDPVYRVDDDWFSDAAGKKHHEWYLKNITREILTCNYDPFPMIPSHDNVIIVSPVDGHFFCIESWDEDGDNVKFKVFLYLPRYPTVGMVRKQIAEVMGGEDDKLALRRDVAEIDDFTVFRVGNDWFSDTTGKRCREWYVKNKFTQVLRDDQDTFPIAGGCTNFINVSPIDGVILRIENWCDNWDRSFKLFLNLPAEVTVGKVLKKIAEEMGRGVEDTILRRDVATSEGNPVFRSDDDWFCDSSGRRYNVRKVEKMTRQILNSEDPFPVASLQENALILSQCGGTWLSIECRCSESWGNHRIFLPKAVQPTNQDIYRAVADQLGRPQEDLILSRNIGHCAEHRVYEVLACKSLYFADLAGIAYNYKHVVNLQKQVISRDESKFTKPGEWMHSLYASLSGTWFYIENRCSNKWQWHSIFVPYVTEPTVSDIHRVIAHKFGRSRIDFVLSRNIGYLRDEKVFEVTGGNLFVKFANAAGIGCKLDDVDDIRPQLLSQMEEKFETAGKWTHNIVASLTDSYKPEEWKEIRRLGSGGFGQVYLCEENHTKLQFAMKVMKKSDEEFVRVTKNEILLLSSLKHETIVQYLGSQTDLDGTFRIFLQYMPGGSLTDEIIANVSLTEARTSHYTHQLLRGLQFLHENLVIHRDIKPDNILSDGEGNVKVADFGISRRLGNPDFVSQNDEENPVKSGLSSCARSHVGTPYYTAPEVYMNQKYKMTADVWSLAASVLEMITGEPPWYFQCDQIRRYIRMKLQPNDNLPDEISDALRDFFDKTFVYDPNKRATVEDLLQHPFCCGKVD